MIPTRHNSGRLPHAKGRNGLGSKRHIRNTYVRRDYAGLSVRFDYPLSLASAKKIKVLIEQIRRISHVTFVKIGD